MDRKLLQGLADNEAVLAAVRELLEDQFSTDNLKATESDELLGQMVRARLVGLAAIETAFKEIAACRSVPQSTDKINPAI